MVTAEAASVHDTTNYAPVPVTYSVSNVGYAATGGLLSGGTAQQFGASPSSRIGAAQIASFASPNSYLSSVVQYSGTAGAAATYSNSPNTNTIIASGTVITPSNAMSSGTGTVGSQCDILDSTEGSSSTTVTMAWRRSKLSRERRLDQTLRHPIAGIPGEFGRLELVQRRRQDRGGSSTTTIAMEMSFDDSINMSMDGERPPPFKVPISPS